MVRDTHGDATGYAQVSVRFNPQAASTGSSTKSLALNPVDGRAGLYEVTLPPLGKGDHVVIVSASKDGKELGKSEVKFTVVPPADEMFKLAADHALLRQIAAATRGGSYELGRFPELVDELIRSDTSTRPEQMSIRFGNFAHAASALSGRPADWPREYDLPLQGAIVVVLLTVEWMLRRRWQIT